MAGMTPGNSNSENCVAIITLGCSKNLVDSELIASMLSGAGVEVTTDAGRARVAIVNTCGFIGPAKEESVDAVLEAANLKGRGPLETLIVAGCLSERYGEELRELLPEVDCFVGVDPAGAAGLALKALGMSEEGLPAGQGDRTFLLTPPGWCYLRIADGCDNRCAYCVVPLIRGPLRSRSLDEVLREARRVVEAGAKELNLIAQDTTAYGTDWGGKPGLQELLSRLCRIEGLNWVRLLYAHPAHLQQQLIDLMAAEEKICPYIDLPLQHISDPILARMGRKITRARIEDLIGKLREVIKGVTIRTTFIVGFPGEDDEQFEELLEFVDAVRFERVGCFAYSQEEGTRAADFDRQVPEGVKEDRLDLLMTLQQEIAYENAASRVGEETSLLVEESGTSKDSFVVGRTPREAPDVDPVVYLEQQAAPLPPGAMVRVKITASSGYDCIARLAAPGG